MQAVKQRVTKSLLQNSETKYRKKKLKKLLKNLLTKARECDIIVEHFRPRRKVEKNFLKNFSKTY